MFSPKYSLLDQMLKNKVLIKNYTALKMMHWNTKHEQTAYTYLAQSKQVLLCNKQ